MKNSIRNIALIAACVFALGGCETMKPLPEKTVVKNQVVLVSLPEEFYSIPNNVPAPDVETASQKDVAEWIAKNELRTVVLENKMIQLKNYEIFAFNLLTSINGKDSVLVVDPTKKDSSGVTVFQPAKPFASPTPSPSVQEFVQPPVAPPANADKETRGYFRPSSAFVKASFGDAAVPTPRYTEKGNVGMETRPEYTDRPLTKSEWGQKRIKAPKMSTPQGR